jgi:hypothetical protein
MRELIGAKVTIGLQGCSAEEGPIKRPLTLTFFHAPEFQNKRIIVCLCSFRVLINEIDFGQQNSEFEFWLYQGFLPQTVSHIL